MTRKPTALGLAALRPRPMTAAQTADLVERTRRNQRDAAVDDRHIYVAPQPMPTTSRARCAARLAFLIGCSIREAANELGLIDDKSSRKWFRTYYPTAEAPRYRRERDPLVVRTRRAQTTEPAAPQFPPGSTCACCAGPAVGELNREPLGRNGGLVNVCDRCATERPAGSNRHRVVNAQVRR